MLTYIFQGSSYLSPYAYGIMHRMHHAYADTEEDPHSPKYDPNALAMMWRTKNVYNGIYYRKTQVEERFTKNVPDWKFIDKIGGNYISRIVWGLAYVAFYVVFATHWWMFLLLPIHFVMGPFHGVIINWCAHKYGYTNYTVKDTSKNLMPWDLIMMGEGLHNNHHTHSSRANFGTKWWEFDPSYPLIKIMHWLRIIRLKSPKLQPIEA